LQELAVKIGLRKQTLARYENGQIAIGAPSLRTICTTLHVSADQLLGLRIPDISDEALEFAAAFDRIEDATLRDTIVRLIERDRPVSGGHAV
jgi:transcriptional regulator with XRE-family HTH domain